MQRKWEVFSKIRSNVKWRCWAIIAHHKKVRNKLAHGEQSFEDYGRTLVRTKLEEFFQDTQSFLNMVLNIVSDFISQKNTEQKKLKTWTKGIKKTKDSNIKFKGLTALNYI